jgi:1-acyl-sn-glycerol-3-phosphate acyltransferase
VNLVGRIIYDTIVGGMKLYRRLLMDAPVWGRSNIPEGAKIYVSNHITSHEILLLTIFPERVHVVVGPACKSRVIARMAAMCDQINAMPSNRRNVVSEAVEYLRRGGSIFMNPEGDFQETFRLGRFYPGVARMQRLSGAPIVPIGVLAPRSRLREYAFTTEVNGRIYRTVAAPRGPYCVNIGTAFIPEAIGETDAERDEAILGQIRSRIEALVEDIRVNRFWL